MRSRTRSIWSPSAASDCPIVLSDEPPGDVGAPSAPRRGRQAIPPSRWRCCAPSGSRKWPKASQSIPRAISASSCSAVSGFSGRTGLVWRYSLHRRRPRTASQRRSITRSASVKGGVLPESPALLGRPQWTDPLPLVARFAAQSVRKTKSRQAYCPRGRTLLRLTAQSLRARGRRPATARTRVGALQLRAEVGALQRGALEV